MTARQWLLLLAAVLLIVFLYNLPRSVVENTTTDIELEKEQASALASHAFSVSESHQKAISSLRNLISQSDSNEKVAIFADSLAGIYLKSNLLDSAEYFSDLILKKNGSVSSQKKAGELYFRIFGISSDSERTTRVADKAAKCFERILEDGEDPDIQANLAMTKVVSSNPMQGIMMLRGILEENPENETALYNLGLLSMQSGQYEKAVERFEKLMTIDGANIQAGFYLAVSYFEEGDMENAKNWFEKIKTESSDPAILNSADQYLKQLNEL